MKKLKLGFTVVEMITAMTIVGVTAAFVIPMSVKAFNKHQTGIVLGKVYKQIIQGNQNIIQLANMNDESGSYTNVLSTITKSDLYPHTDNNEDDSVLDNLADFVGPYWGLNNQNVEVGNILPIKNYDGSNAPVPNILNDSYCIRFDFSNISSSVAIFKMEGVDSAQRTNDETQYVLYIDTTGLRNPPNTYGKDIFAFILINNGTLRPFGAVEDPDNNIGLGFTEQVVREGFRVTYY